nr:reverse transcriptase domain-containing protein [Tanacetum cinerariifolium]
QSLSKHSILEVDRTSHQSLEADNGSSPPAYSIPVGPTIPSSQMGLIDKAPVPQVRHQVLNRFGIPLCGLVGYPASPREKPRESLKLLVRLPVASPSTYLQFLLWNVPVTTFELGLVSAVPTAYALTIVFSRATFLAYFMQQKKYVKDLVEIYNIKQRDGETIKDFMECFKIETGLMKWALECMRISRFMHRVNNPELTRRLNEHVPKTMEEMMITTTAFIRGEVAAASKKKGHPPPPMVTPVEKRSSNKFCVFHNDKGHSTDECMQLKKQIKELVQAGKLEERTRPVNFTVALHPDFPNQEVVIEGSLSYKARTELCSVLKKNLDIFAWQPFDMTGVPRSIAEHRLNIWEGYSLVRQKKRGLAPERARAIQAKVQNLVDAGIMREVYYHDWLSNPVMVKKHDGSWRMCVDFTDSNKACPQDCYPLSEIDWKVESLCGYPFKCFLDAYKGYHQIQLTEADEEKTTFHTGHGVYCYTKMPFDDLVVKSYTEAEMMRDIEETFRTLRKVNMKLNPKKCLFGLAEGVFLGGKISAAVSDLKKCIKKSDFCWTAEAEQAFQQLKQHLSELPLLVAPEPQEELIMYLSATYGAGPELNYSPMEKLVLSLVFAAKRLRRDGSSCVDGSGPGLILTSPGGVKFTYALRFQFMASNNEAEYEALIAGLWIAAQMGVKNVQANVDSKLVANQVLGTYVAKEDNDKIEAKVVATITGEQVKKFVLDNIVCRFGIPGEIISDNGNSSVTTRLRTVIPTEIEMPTYRIAAVDVVNIDEELRLNLDLLEERRERAAVCKARAKSKMMKYYNARVRSVAFKPCDFVYHSNDASHAIAGGKLGPKWEGPYEVTEALDNGAYKLRSTDGTVLPRTWNVTNLKRCYL